MSFPAGTERRQRGAPCEEEEARGIYTLYAKMFVLKFIRKFTPVLPRI
jgi:hypothetical protein